MHSPQYVFVNNDNDDVDNEDDVMEVGDSNAADQELLGAPRQLGEKSIIMAQRPRGGLRDVIYVECLMESCSREQSRIQRLL